MKKKIGVWLRTIGLACTKKERIVNEVEVLSGSAGEAFKPSIPRKVKNQNTPSRNRSIEERRREIVTERSTRSKLIVERPSVAVGE